MGALPTPAERYQAAIDEQAAYAETRGIKQQEEKAFLETALAGRAAYEAARKSGTPYVAPPVTKFDAVFVPETQEQKMAKRREKNANPVSWIAGMLREDDPLRKAMALKTINPEDYYQPEGAK